MPDSNACVHPGVWFRKNYLKPSGMTVNLNFPAEGALKPRI